MKKLITIFAILITQLMVAQYAPYLHIERGEGIETSISYPPNTEFHLSNSNGDWVLSDGDLEEPFEITSTHTLLLQPTYKEDTDKLILTSGRILMKTPYEKDVVKVTKTKKKNSYGRNNGHITGAKEYFESKNEGERNVLIIFNNDLVFRYFDGVARAWYDGREIKVKGNYIIELPDSVAKISYNPKNGETWWFFENNK
ncbi:MAG: hypothetical protein KJO73_03560 [Croceitalea sp.]|nr:hypothetical protein [Croceitalea sp.]